MINRHVSRLSSSHRTTAQHGSDQSDNSEEDDDDDEEDEDDDEAQVVTVEGYSHFSFGINIPLCFIYNTCS